MERTVCIYIPPTVPVKIFWEGCSGTNLGLCVTFSCHVSLVAFSLEQFVFSHFDIFRV